MSLITCPECGNSISDKSKVCIHCGYPLQERGFVKQNIIVDDESISKKNTEIEVPSSEDMLEKLVENKTENKSAHKKKIKRKTKKPSKFKTFSKKKKITILVSIVLAIIFALGIGLGVGIPLSFRAKYLWVEDALMHFDRYNMYLIGEKIESLPVDYRDISAFKTKYKIVMNEVNVIENISPNYLSDEDAENARKAYANLVSYNDISFEINTIDYLKTVDLKILFYGKEWKNGLDVFCLQDGTLDAETSALLYSSLPNDKEGSKEYYYTERKVYGNYIYGYENKDNSDEYFDAYKITKVLITEESEQIVIYCFKNDMTYTLSAD